MTIINVLLLLRIFVLGEDANLSDNDYVIYIEYVDNYVRCLKI